MDWKIPLFKIYWDEEDLKSIADVVRSGMSWAEGKAIKEFEDRIKEYIGTKYSLVFNSGTSALHALLLAYGIKGEDEVIVPSFTFIATVNSVLFVGAKPVFADIDEKTFGLNPEDVKKKITRKTKAIITVHYGGCPCRIEELEKIAKRYKLILIEDAAEAFGAGIKERKVGAFGNSAMLSFCQNKIITTGEGGALVTNDKEIYEKLRLLRSHGRLESEDYFSSAGLFDYVALGYNFRMPTYVAALGIVQIKKAKDIIEMRRANSSYFTDRLRQYAEDIITPDPPEASYHHVYQLYTIRIARYRDDLMKYLASQGIMTKVYFQPVHLTYFYRNKLKLKCRLPVTENISKEALTLPMYPALKKKEMNYIAERIGRFMRRKTR